MNQRELADRFDNDIDNLLQEVGVSDQKPVSPEYEAMLKVAHTLATSDFSRQSHIRPSLRRRLLSRIDQSPTSVAEVPGPLSLIKQFFKPDPTRPRPAAPFWKNKLILTTLASLILVVGLVTGGVPSGLRQRLVDLLAQVLVYLPWERPVSPHMLALRWQFHGEGGLSSDPVAANGLIYVGGNSGYVYALDGQSGQEVWRFKTEASVNFSPAVAAGTIYVVSAGYGYALDSSTGQEQWRFKAEGQFSMTPLTSDTTVYLGSDQGWLYALDNQTGRERWRYKAGNAILPYATVAGKTLYVGSQDHFLYALELETGREKWRFDAGNWLSAAPIEVAGLVYVGSYDEYLYVLKAETGQEQQRYDLGKAVRTSATLAAGMIYFGSYDSYLHAVEGATGEEKWRFKMGKQTRSAAVVAEGVIFIGSGDGYLYEVDARTGTELARYGVDSHLYTAPTVVGDTIYFVSGKGELYAVQRSPLPVPTEQSEAPEQISVEDEPAGFQFTPGGWYVAGQAEVIRFRGRMVDGAGNPVNGVSVQADNGTTSLLSVPSGPNRWQPKAAAGAWEIVIPNVKDGAGWWWLTVVRAECRGAGQADFNPQCQQFTRLSESVKVKVVYPAETVINADWTCQWRCEVAGEK